MKEYNFVLKFAFERPETDPVEYIGLLERSGCDDAVMGVGRLGRISLDFGREAKSAHDAICSAILDVRRAVPGIRLIEATPDLVGLTEIGELVGQTRQNIRRAMLTEASFPLAIHDGTSSLFHLSDVITWASQKGRKVDSDVHEVAMATRALNLAREIDLLPPVHAEWAQHQLYEALAS